MRCMRALLFGLALLALASFPRLCDAREVQVLRTPGGIGLWLVEEHGLPVVALRFAIRGGSLEDPPGKEGVGDLVAAMLDQGAGPLDAEAFQDRLAAIGSQFSFSVSRSAFSGGFVAISRHLHATAELMRLALHEPRLRHADFERVRQQKSAAAAQDERNPERMALRLFYETAFVGHVYARPVRGTTDTLRRLTVADVQAQRQRMLRRKGLHVVLVGALAPDAAMALVDAIFTGLPEGNAAIPVPPTEPKPIETILRGLEGQGLETAVFALPMPGAGDPRYFQALALTHILGSGNFDARLTREVRVKRGLTYAIAAHMLTDPAASFLLGTVSTEPGMMAEALGAVRTTLAAFQRDGPDLRELENARSSLNGSYLLGADGSANLAGHLIGLWTDGLDAGYDRRRKAGIDAIRLDDARQTARAFYDPGAMRFLILRPAESNHSKPHRGGTPGDALSQHAPKFDKPAAR